MERQALKLQIKSLTEEGTFVGMASVFGNTDLEGDSIERGAFTKTLQERGAKVTLLWSHRRDEPIGIGDLTETTKGLEIAGILNLEVSRAREIYALMKQGAIKGLSIGYKTVSDAWDTARKIRRLLELKLLEVSLVTIPANEQALVSAVKSGDEDKAGRVLSASTKKRIQDAVDEFDRAKQTLLALLDEQDDGAADKHVEPEILHSAINDWRQAGHRLGGSSDGTKATP